MWKALQIASHQHHIVKLYTFSFVFFFLNFSWYRTVSESMALHHASTKNFMFHSVTFISTSNFAWDDSIQFTFPPALHYLSTSFNILISSRTSNIAGIAAGSTRHGIFCGVAPVATHTCEYLLTGRGVYHFIAGQVTTTDTKRKTPKTRDMMKASLILMKCPFACAFTTKSEYYGLGTATPILIS